MFLRHGSILDKNGDELNGLDQQMVYFHFIKFEIPRFYIQKLNPDSFNFSCWDGMDRAGIESAYYNLLL